MTRHRHRAQRGQPAGFGSHAKPFGRWRLLDLCIAKDSGTCRWICKACRGHGAGARKPSWPESSLQPPSPHDEAAHCPGLRLCPPPHTGTPCSYATDWEEVRLGGSRGTAGLGFQRTPGPGGPVRGSDGEASARCLSHSSITYRASSPGWSTAVSLEAKEGRSQSSAPAPEVTASSASGPRNPGHRLPTPSAPGP